MRSFNLLARLLGRSAAPAPFVAGEALAALQGSLDAGKSSVLPKGAVLVPASKHPEAERIAESIREYPDDWKWARKGYDIQHVPSGFRLWVANDDYGLAEVHDNNGKTDFSKPEQAIIWPAVADWLGHRKVGFTGRLPKARITGRSGTFWCYAKEHPWAGVGESPEEAYRAWRHAISSQARSDMKPNEYLQVRSATL
ncbi:hypothetical protein [Pseudomonas sp. NFACC04-2]|uniref:hypothetical protein n=1 Tax=Pseudomonas sp. NFACC04-2 TaxID=1566242 RepID=UPI0009085801|nr:hypothetical protein [Pseudomonas sp. NFACC04-2]SFW77451.1 hypothetical protein SAMN03159439_04658 [Pseudomonas sp. NFACC04-2]